MPTEPDSSSGLDMSNTVVAIFTLSIVFSLNPMHRPRLTQQIFLVGDNPQEEAAAVLAEGQ